MSSTSSSPNAVDFDDPPVSEVAFAVLFDGPVVDEVGILSEFWPAIKADYPRHERHPPLLPVSENFDVAPPTLQIRLQGINALLPQRYWFLSDDGTLLVQVQPDRFVFNWRQVSGDEEYPRYETLLPKFLALLTTFLGTNAVQAAGPTVAWVELQYTNPVSVNGTSGSTHGQLARILNFLVPDPEREVLPEVEDTQLQQRFRISGDDGQPRGRLYLTAAPAIRPEKQLAYIVTLLARGRPGQGDPIDGVRDFLGIAHDLIVRGFKDVTTPEMHKLWGIK
jgi:uncharacterized protein (TIGR04255 family)